jgi:hypothetical protein
MTVVLGDQRITALRGPVNWEHRLTKKEWYRLTIEEDLPMLRKDETPCLEYSESDGNVTVTLEFDIQPIDMSVSYYSIDAWGDRWAEYYEMDADRTNFSFELMEDEGIYEVWVRWYTNDETNLAGDAHYSFYTKKVS